MKSNNTNIPFIVKGGYASLDGHYGPYKTVEDALFNIPHEDRAIGKTVGVIQENTIVEYQFKNGIENSDLVLKIKGGDDQETVTWESISGKPTIIAEGGTAEEARNKIGAGTSNLTIGTSSTTAAAGNHTHTQYAPTSHNHTAANISDSTIIGRSVLMAADAAAARTAIGAGTGNSNLTIGTTATTAKAGNYHPTWAQVTDKPVLFSGDYNDLTNKPAIPTVGNGTITITQGGISKGSFTTNQSGNTTVEIDAGGGGSDDLMINITHADLLALVNNSELVAGQQYRITDYVATVDTDVYNPDSGFFYARSNNHAFDIIVTADSVNKLNENARAIRHEGDTYFPSTIKFEAWKIKYTIDNDNTRFSWAVSTGKGVIYQLIDEFNNDVCYDFKSIQFQRDSIWVYTFGGATDGSLELENCYNNTVLNSGMNLSDNTFGNYCHSNTFGGYCLSNIFGNNCHSNNFGADCYSNTFGDDCYSNKFGYNCYSNKFGTLCYSNTFGDSYGSNTFGDDCRSNTFGDYCNSNIFGDMYSNYNISSFISNIDFVSEITNFTTPPNGNVVNVTKTPSGVVFSQVINATTTESFDV